MWYGIRFAGADEGYRAFMDHVNSVGRSYPSWNGTNQEERNEQRRQLIENADAQINDEYGGYNNFYNELNNEYVRTARELANQFPATRQTNLNNAHFVLPNGEIGPNVFDHSYMNKIVMHNMGLNPNLMRSDDQFGPIFGGNVRVMSSGRTDMPGPIQIFHYPNSRQLATLEKYYPDRVYYVGGNNPTTVQGLKAALRLLRKMRGRGEISYYEEMRPESMKAHNAWRWNQPQAPQ